MGDRWSARQTRPGGMKSTCSRFRTGTKVADLDGRWTGTRLGPEWKSALLSQSHRRQDDDRGFQCRSGITVLVHRI